MTILYQFISHLNKGTSMKNRTALLQKINMFLHVPVLILISWN
jgi:hypothetical protein